MGIPERKNRQKHALRERILDAARRIVMREGFAALSMRKIADAIEYSPATLYLHFASRDEIAQALCEEGYAQLLASFAPLAGVADPGERLKAFGRAYVAFGVAHPQTYRLIFMEDPSYTGAAMGGEARKAQMRASGTGGAVLNAADAATAATTSPDGAPAALTADDDAGAATLHIMISALDALKVAGRLSASTDLGVWAEAFWATLHGIVALNLTCPVFPTVSLDTVVDLTLDVWLGASGATGSGAQAASGVGSAVGASDLPASAGVVASAAADTVASDRTDSTVKPKRKATKSATKLAAKPATEAAADATPEPTPEPRAKPKA